MPRLERKTKTVRWGWGGRCPGFSQRRRCFFSSEKKESADKKLRAKTPQSFREEGGRRDVKTSWAPMNQKNNEKRTHKKHQPIFVSSMIFHGFSFCFPHNNMFIQKNKKHSFELWPSHLNIQKPHSLRFLRTLFASPRRYFGQLAEGSIEKKTERF